MKAKRQKLPLVDLNEQSQVYGLYKERQPDFASSERDARTKANLYIKQRCTWNVMAEVEKRKVEGIKGMCWTFRLAPKNEAFTSARLKISTDRWVRDGTWFHVDTQATVPFGALVSFRDKARAERCAKAIETAILNSLAGAVEPQE